MNQTAIETTKDIATLNLEMEPQKPVIRKDHVSQFETIKDIVLEHYNLHWDNVKRPGQKPDMVNARGLIYYFMKDLTLVPLKWIGKQFISRNPRLDGLDHSSVINGIRRIKDQLSWDKKFQKDVAIIADKIYSNPVFID